MSAIIFPFKTETRASVPTGYPYINWYFEGIRYEALVDTGADNILAGIDFLQVLHSRGITNVDEIYEKKNFRNSSGVGGDMLTTMPIPLKIELKLPEGSSLFELGFSCCLPKSINEYNDYFSKQSEVPVLERQLAGTKDQRLIKTLTEKIDKIVISKRKFNPPILFGKPFISKFKYFTFVVNDDRANGGSHYIFELRDDYKPQSNVTN